MKHKILFSASPDAGGGGAATVDISLPQTPAGPGTQVTVFKTGGDGKITPAQNVQPTAAIPDNPWAAQLRSSSTETQAQEQQPEAQTHAQPTVLSQDENFTTVLSPDGKTLQLYWNPVDGQPAKIYTQVPFSPEAVAHKLTQDQSFIRTIRTGQQSTQQVPTVEATPKAAPPQTAEQIKAAILERAKAVASDVFHKVDPNIAIDPLAETIATLLGESEANRLEAEQAQQTKATEAQRINSELQWVDKISPGFDWQHPFVGKIRSQNPNWGPQQVYKEVVFWVNQAALGQPANGHAPTQPQAPAPQQPQVDPKLFATPSGSAPQSSANQWDSHPEVRAAVDSHERFMKQAGKVATPESTARARQNAISGILNRGKFIPSIQRPIT